MEDLAVVVNSYNENVTVKETIDIIKSNGFNNVFLQWYDKNDIDLKQEEQLKYIKENNMNVIFVHLRFNNIDSLWENNDLTKIEIQKYKDDLKYLKDNNIDLVILHMIRRLKLDKNNKYFINNIKEIIEYAEELKIKIAFENTKVYGVLEYIFDNINSDYIGVCYDFGHDHAFFNDEFDFDRFKNKILAVHIHDNFGTFDEHLLPFDGSIDFERVIAKLKDANYRGPITLELCYKGDYTIKYTLDEFYKEAYKRGIELKNIIDKLL